MMPSCAGRRAAAVVCAAAAGLIPGTIARQSITRRAPRDARHAITEPQRDTGPAPSVLYSAFSLDLFRAVAADSPGSNVFISPASAGIALAMTAAGAGGTTRTAMAQVLGVQPSTVDSLGPRNAAVIGALRQQKAVVLDVANSIWASAGRPFLPSFLDLTRRWYHADVTTLVLHGPGALHRINTWVAGATENRIPVILTDTLPDSAAMVLINAVYFKGKWDAAFDTSRTRPRRFTRLNGTSAMRPSMAKDFHGLLYTRDSGMQMARIPYRGERIAMYVLLPDSGTSLASFVSTIDTAHWGRWQRKGSVRAVHLELPRFEMSYGTSLKPELEHLGMQVAFDPRHASFSGMLPTRYLRDTNAYIDDVLQRAYVKVDEQGTEAAAATSVGVGLSPQSIPPPPVPFIVNRPFVVAIRDDQTGLMLFLGQIVNPR